MTNELYTNVRSVQIPTFQIEEIEQRFGAKLVPDEEADLIKTLDRALREYRDNFGKEPDMIMLVGEPGFLFKHMTMSINVLGMTLPGAYNKPAWFKFKRYYKLTH